MMESAYWMLLEGEQKQELLDQENSTTFAHECSPAIQ